MLETVPNKKKAKKTQKKVIVSPTMHSAHIAELPRLRRVRGQIDGIERMIVDKRYCVEILQQIKAARAALQGLESAVLKTHMQGCVRAAMTSKDAFDADKKIQEIIELLGR